MNKFAVKLSSFIITFATMFVVAVPAFAADPSIEYDKETIQDLATTQEYSLDNKTWRGVYGDAPKIDLKPLIKNTGSLTVYYRTANDEEAVTSTIVVPPRPAAPKGLKFVGKENTTLDVINTTDLHEVKYDLSTWVTSPSDGTLVGSFEKAGAKLNVRLKATDSAFASVPTILTVPVQRVLPASVKYDLNTDGVIVATGMEYQIGSRPTGGTASSIVTDGWKTVKKGQTRVLRAEIDGDLKSLDGSPEGTAAYVYVRSKNTATAGVSAYASVKIPQSIAAPTNPDLDITNENLKSVSTLMEYRVLTDKTALTATYSTPKWTAISSSSQSIAKTISATTSKTPNTLVQVRLKAVKGSGTVLDKPASAVKELKMTGRPATPKVTDLTISYDPNSQTMSVPATHQWMYSTDARWTDGGSDVNIKSKIPPRGSKAVTIFVRVKAAEGIGTDADTPASAPFKGGKINPTPAAPKSPTFNKNAKTITGVTEKMEYVIGNGTSWDPVVGKSIDLSSQSEGASGSVKVRLKYTANAPASEEKAVLFTIPVKK